MFRVHVVEDNAMWAPIFQEVRSSETMTEPVTTVENDLGQMEMVMMVQFLRLLLHMCVALVGMFGVGPHLFLLGC